MKQITLVCLLFLPTLFVQSQQRPKEIDDLKKFIGYNKSEIQSVMKKKGYPYYESEDDEREGPFLYKYFNGEEYEEIKLIINNEGKVIGAGSDEFTAEDYIKIKDYLTKERYTRTVKEKMLVNVGLERVDLWESSDGKWKVRIDYNVGISNMPITVTDITLTTGLVYGFE